MSDDELLTAWIIRDTETGDSVMVSRYTVAPEESDGIEITAAAWTEDDFDTMATAWCNVIDGSRFYRKNPPNPENMYFERGLHAVAFGDTDADSPLYECQNCGARHHAEVDGEPEFDCVDCGDADWIEVNDEG